MQNELLVVAGASVVVGVSLEVELEVVDDMSVDVELIVMVVIEVPEGDGHERSGKSSWRFTFGGAPQPAMKLPGCLFPAKSISSLVFESIHSTTSQRRWPMLHDGGLTCDHN